MDELLQELDVSFRDLYKLHAGESINDESEDSDGDSATCSESSLDHLEPPVYSFEELERNLVVIEAANEESELFTSGESKRIHSARLPEEIAKNLVELITSTYCHICRRNAHDHYNFTTHYKKVFNWLKNELAKYDGSEVNLKWLFCDACNSALSGNETAQNHYEESSHKKNASIFCSYCLQKVTKIPMTEHIQSHKSEQLFTQRDKENDILIVRQGLQQRSTETINIEVPYSEVNNKNKEQQTYAMKTNNNNNYCVNQEYTASEGPKREDKNGEVKEYGILAQHILNCLTPTFCYVCNVPALGHYTTLYHNKIFLNWIIKNSHILELFKIESVESLVCFACRAIFFNSSFADVHYATEDHKHNMIYFCKPCMVYDDPKNHIEHKQVSLSAYSFKKNDGLKNGITLGHHDPGRIIATELFLIKTPIYCYICQQSVNLHTFPNHYQEKEHIMKLRTWLNVKIQKSGVKIDPNLIHCEACSLDLCGTNEAINHYKMAFHIYNQQTYCQICVVRGTPNAVYQHYFTPEHRYNYETLRSFYRPNLHTIVNPVLQDNKGLTPLPEELANAVTTTECKLCGVIFNNDQEANVHLSAKEHKEYVKVWLEQNSILGSNTNRNSESQIDVSSGNKVSQQYIQSEVMAEKKSSFAEIPVDKMETDLKSDDVIKCDENQLNYSCESIIENKKTNNETNQRVPYDEKSDIDPTNPLQETLDEKGNIDPTNPLQGKDIFEESVNSLVPIITLPVGKYTSCEDTEVYKNINDEVKKLLYNVYCSKEISPEKSLAFLKRFNNELNEAQRTPNIGDNDTNKNTYEHLDVSDFINKRHIGTAEVVTNTITISGVIDKYFTEEKESGEDHEDSLTEFFHEQESLLVYERNKLKTIKSIRHSDDDKSLRNVSLIEAVNRQKKNVKKGNSNRRCVIL